MKFVTFRAVVFLLAVLVLFAPAAIGQTGPNILFAGAGSAAVFNSLYDAALTTHQCGTNLWSQGAGVYPPPFTVGGTLRDVRNTAIPDDNSNVWVSFDGTAANNYTDATVICFYISVESGVGVRGFLGSPRAQLLLSGAPGSASGNVVNGYRDNVGALPQAIWNDINVPGTPCVGTTLTTCTNVTGTTISLAFSDMRPEDAQYAVFRALAGPRLQFCYSYNFFSDQCYFDSAKLGYGNWPSAYDAGPNPVLTGTPIMSAFSPTVATPTYFEQAPGIVDAFTGQKVLNYATYEVGAVPVLVLVSNENTSSTGLGAGVPGSYVAQTIGLYTAAYVFDGLTFRTQDLTGLAGTTPMSILTDQPLSAVFNSFEFNVVRTDAIQNSQEDGLSYMMPPWESSFNPIEWFGLYGYRRFRAIGPIDMGNALNLAPVERCGGPPPDGCMTPDRIGYMFWSYANVAPLAGSGCTSSIIGTFPWVTSVSCATNPTGHYLLLNGVDPLFNIPVDNPQGPLNPPTCNFAQLPCPAIPFTHINDGSYPAWTIVHMISDGSAIVNSTSPLGMLYNTLTTTSAAKYSDFDPISNLQVFRMHRAAGWGQQGNPAGYFGPVNGTVCAPPFPPHSASFTGQDMGSDMGGAVTTIMADRDFALDYQGAAPSPAFCGVPAGAFIGQTGQVQ